MSKEFIDNRVDEAHNLIDQRDYDRAVEILKNIKIRIHDQEIENKITKFEKTKDEHVEKSLTEIRQHYMDSIKEHGNEGDIARNYAISYLNFYDKLRKEHDIY